MSQQRTVSYEVAGDLGELRQIVYSLHQHRPEEHPSDEWGDGRMTLFLLCQDQPHAEELWKQLGQDPQRLQRVLQEAKALTAC